MSKEGTSIAKCKHHNFTRFYETLNVMQHYFNLEIRKMVESEHPYFKEMLATILIGLYFFHIVDDFL